MLSQLRFGCPKTIETMFNVTLFREHLFFTVVEKKRIANFIANKLSEMIFEKVGGIIQACIAPENLKGFHTKNM